MLSIVDNSRYQFRLPLLVTLLVALACSDSASPGTSVGHVAVTPAIVDLAPGDSLQLQATAFGANGASVENGGVTWSSSAAAVATVSAGGMVTAIGAGTAIISARILALTGLATVTVLPQLTPGERVVVYPSVELQTMMGWEATGQVGQSECNATAYQNYRGALMDRLTNELGINRVRLGVNSGAENSVDWQARWRAGLVDRATFKQHWYESINDNADPRVIDPAGFQWSWLDSDAEATVVPLRQRLAARGEKLYVTLNYTDFGGLSAFEHTQDPEEYAELILATFQHLQQRFGFVPDAVEIILEPDNTPNWRPDVIGRALVAAGDRLKAAGWRPAFIAPSNTNAHTALLYVDELVRVPRVFEYLTDLAYHRYSGVSDEVIAGIAARGAQYGLRTGMLELIGADHEVLHQDLTLGRNSTWQQYSMAYCSTDDNGARHYNIDDSNPSNPVITLGSRSRYLRQYFLFVRFGAVRIGASSGDDRFAPVAFRNTDGRHVVVVKAGAGGNFSIEGLPPGRYGLKYTTGAQYDVDLPDVTLQGGQLLPANIPAAGVITIYRR